MQRSRAAKLTPEQVKEIRRLYTEHKTKHAILAEMYGISKSQVSTIVCYRSWSDI